MGREIRTLRDLRKVAPMFGKEAVLWADLKIKESPNGEDEEVLADDTQIMFLLLSFSERAAAINGEPI